MNDLQIEAIPALADNYIWLLHRGGPDAAVVDPGESAPVRAALAARGLSLSHILITHHHWDHTDGVDALKTVYDPVIFGPDDDRCPEGTRGVAASDTVALPDLDLEFHVLDVPAHTRSHIAFHDDQRLFSGDTLFSVGCGKLFEGDAGQMLAAMDKFSELDPDTWVYCGHEYTVSNCEFALQVEPENPALKQRLQQAQTAQAQGQPSVPSRLADELKCNPFMRCREASVATAAHQRNPEAKSASEVLATLRQWKNEY